MKDALLSIVIAEAFLCGVVYGFGMALMMRRHSPTVVRCDAGDERTQTGALDFDKILEELRSDRSADA